MLVNRITTRPHAIVVTDAECFIKMPKYAVAVGRKIGVYETFDECSAQVKGYPNAKFKKFDTEMEAQKFITANKESGYNKSFQKIKKCKDFDFNKCIQSSPIKPENQCPSVSYPVAKVSPSNPLLNNINNRISKLEEKLDKFITSSKDIFDSLVNRIDELEKMVDPRKATVKKPQLERFKEELVSNITEENDLEAHGSETSNKKLIQVDELQLNEIDFDVHCEWSKPKRIRLDVSEGAEFIRNENGFVMVYTDGACSNNGKMKSRAGIGVWFNHNHPLNVSAPVIGPPTNNNAEIQAARIAIRQASKAGIKRLVVHTDSKFLINCITQWIHKWKKNDWKLTSGGEVKNKDELVKLDSALQNIEVVEWKYVAGHRGILGNEMADKLARKGAEEFNCYVTYSTKIDACEYLGLG